MSVTDPSFAPTNCAALDTPLTTSFDAKPSICEKSLAAPLTALISPGTVTSYRIASAPPPVDEDVETEGPHRATETNRATKRDTGRHKKVSAHTHHKKKWGQEAPSASSHSRRASESRFSLLAMLSPPDSMAPATPPVSWSIFAAVRVRIPGFSSPTWRSRTPSSTPRTASMRFSSRGRRNGNVTRCTAGEPATVKLRIRDDSHRA